MLVQHSFSFFRDEHPQFPLESHQPCSRSCDLGGAGPASPVPGVGTSPRLVRAIQPPGHSDWVGGEQGSQSQPVTASKAQFHNLLEPPGSRPSPRAGLRRGQGQWWGPDGPSTTVRSGHLTSVLYKLNPESSLPTGCPESLLWQVQSPTGGGSCRQASGQGRRPQSPKAGLKTLFEPWTQLRLKPAPNRREVTQANSLVCLFVLSQPVSVGFLSTATKF